MHVNNVCRIESGLPLKWASLSQWKVGHLSGTYCDVTRWWWNIRDKYVEVWGRADHSGIWLVYEAKPTNLVAHTHTHTRSISSSLPHVLSCWLIKELLSMCRRRVMSASVETDLENSSISTKKKKKNSKRKYTNNAVQSGTKGNTMSHYSPSLYNHK